MSDTDTVSHLKSHWVTVDDNDDGDDDGSVDDDEYVGK